jgi:Domain of unknown function (DUF4269)
MSKDFFDIEYLNHGSEVQKKGFAALKVTGILDILHEFDPVLAGTLPLDIFIQGSDLDILCNAVDLSAFEHLLATHFSKNDDFTIHKTSVKGTKSVIVRFHAEDFDFEIFGQPIATRNQLAFRHLLIEDKILQMKGEEFKGKIIALKLSGIKTEPAFANLLNMEGDPYESLLSLAV